MNDMSKFFSTAAKQSQAAVEPVETVKEEVSTPVTTSSQAPQSSSNVLSGIRKGAALSLSDVKPTHRKQYGTMSSPQPSTITPRGGYVDPYARTPYDRGGYAATGFPHTNRPTDLAEVSQGASMEVVNSEYIKSILNIPPEKEVFTLDLIASKVQPMEVPNITDRFGKIRAKVDAVTNAVGLPVVPFVLAGINDRVVSIAGADVLEFNGIKMASPRDTAFLPLEDAYAIAEAIMNKYAEGDDVCFSFMKEYNYADLGLPGEGTMLIPYVNSYDASVICARLANINARIYAHESDFGIVTGFPMFRGNTLGY